ncbi:MAG: hypothetical protein JWM91_5413 [Rhodospirillales bacterium]|nr:hypothetical protein [Rhodospirillales bacterium]
MAPCRVDGAETVHRLHKVRSGAPLERAVGWVGTSLMEQADDLADQWNELDAMIKECFPGDGAIT